MRIPRGCAYYSRYHQMMPALREKMEYMAYTFGQTYDSYLITEPNREYFWSNGFQGVVGFSRIGRYINIPGGLIASNENKNRLLLDLKQFAILNHLTISIYSVLDNDLPLFREYGLQPTKLGEDAIVDLTACDWSGKDFQWIRRQSNFCRRNKLVVKEISSKSCSRELWNQYQEEISRISELHLSTKTQAGEMQLFEGQLLFDHLQRRRLFIVVNTDRDRRIEGFAIINPYARGKGWAIEMYRHLPDSVRGVMPFLIHQIMQILKTEGVREVSLCIVPYLRCPQKIPGDSTLGRNLIGFWAKHFNFLWDLKGLYHFKSRFRPRYANLYVCVFPKITIGSIMAFNLALGVLKFRISRVLKNVLKIRGKSNAYAKPQLEES